MSNSESNKQVAGSHTPGPWSILRGSIVAYTPGLYGLINDGDANEEDLRRIVACVNACKGLSTDELERFGLASAFGTELLEIEKQRNHLATKVADLELALFAENQKRADVERERDQLLAALKEAREALAFANDTPGGPIIDTIWMMHRPETLLDHLDAAIAAVKGGA